MIPYTPTANASVASASGSASGAALSRPGFIPYTPGQTAPVPPLQASASAAPVPANDWQPNLASKAANLALGGASDLGVHLAQLGAHGVAKLVGLIGFPDAQKAIEARIAATPSKNLFGEPVAPLESPMQGAKALAGDALKTGSELGAFAAAPATAGGAALAGAGIGAAGAAGQALEGNAPAADVAKEAALGGALGAGTGAAASGIGQLLGKVGNFGIQSLLKPSKADIADGFSLQTVKDFNLGGTLYQMQDKTQNTLNDLASQLREKLASSNASIFLPDVFNQTAEDIAGATSKLRSFGANSRIQTALGQLQDEIAAISDNGPLSVPDAQIVKQAAGQFGAWQYGQVNPDAKASEIVYNTFYNKLKTAIEDASPDGVKEINQKISKLIPVSNAIVRRIPVFERQAPLSLTDFIGLTASTFEPHALGITLLNFLSKNGMVANQLMQHAATAGNTLAPYASFAASKLAPTLSSPTSSPQQ